jgi:hypothetical protein
MLEEVRRTSLPKLQEQHLQEQAAIVARQAFSTEVRRPALDDGIDDDELIRAMMRDSAVTNSRNAGGGGGGAAGEK